MEFETLPWIWELGYISGIIYVMEYLAMHAFVSAVYPIGIPAYQKLVKIDERFLHLKRNKTYRSKEGKFQFKEDGKIYFLSRFTSSLFSRGRFPLKMTGTINNDNMEVVARVPFGITLSIPLAVVFLIGTRIDYNSSIGVLTQLGYISFFIAIITGFLLVGLFLEKDRVDRMIEELKEIIQLQSLMNE